MKVIKLALMIFCVVPLQAQVSMDYFKKANAFLKANVRTGLVDYAAIKANPAELNSLLDLASTARVKVSNAQTYQAFWINTYNLCVIKGIIEHYPVKRPLDIDGFFDKNTYNVGGVLTTLDDIENKLLRPKFPKESRFHFVLVCAGLGCPPIINEAYTPQKLEMQLQRQTVSALNNSTFIKVGDTEVKISQIFDWYKGDFTQKGGILEYINTFRKNKIPSDFNVDYYPYDWTLNDLK